MRSLQLARIAAQAEGLRWRGLLRRQAIRVALGVVAAVFALACLAALHVAAAIALLHQQVPLLYAVLIVAAVDLVIALVLALLAARDVPGPVEREAVQVREAARKQVLEAAALTTLAGPALRLLGARKFYGLALAALTARYLGGRR